MWFCLLSLTIGTQEAGVARGVVESNSYASFVLFKLFCLYIAKTVMDHLARLGSQSENRIHFILPTGTASDIITKLSDFV